MKIFFALLILYLYTFSSDSYQSVNIDMHGGKEGYLVDEQKSDFKKNGMGMSLFLDSNTSKKSK